MKISELEALIANVRMFYGDINVEMWGSVEVDEDGNGADSSAPHPRCGDPQCGEP